MKWLSKLFKGSSSRSTISAPQPQFLGDENMVWRAPIRSLVTSLIILRIYIYTSFLLLLESLLWIPYCILTQVELENKY